MHIVAGTAWHAQCPIEMLKFSHHTVDVSTWCVTVSSRVRAQPPAVELSSLGVLSEQLPSQTQGTEGPALGRSSETGDPGEVWQGRLSKVRSQANDL